ncbi:hypothetical protein HDU97_006791 [Phlyctochytrium planicorne]|nr:hypothetical protein HDU97_006791 [Phlyctochytrium planicorne]
MASECKVKEFDQSEAISRCRKVKESKLKALFSLSKLADEEVTIHQAHMDEQCHNLERQLVQQSSVEKRQMSECEDLEQAGIRANQLCGLVDKLVAIKETLRFQDEEKEKENAFKASLRQKRAAFQVRLLRLEKRQNSERQELIMAQGRLQNALLQIRNIEISLLKDPQAARRKRKENEISTQQNGMKQQKDFEHLRELQICKVRHMTEINDFEITIAEEMEELLAQNRQEEFELNLKQSQAEKAANGELEKQRLSLAKTQLQEKQKGLKIQAMRSQKRQEKTLAKAQRTAARNREKIVLAENPIITGDGTGDETYGGSEMDGSMESRSQIDDNSSTMDQSEIGSEMDDESVAGEKEKNGEEEAANTLANSMTDKKGNGGVLNEEEKEMTALFEAGRERVRTLQQHHKKTQTALRQHHRALISQRQREHRKKLAEILKDHEEEIKVIKAEQVMGMEELIATQKENESVLRDNESSEKLLGMMLPAHVLEDLEAGIVPAPKSFNTVTIFFTDIPQFKALTTSIDAVDLLNFLNTVYSSFDEVIQDYKQLYTVENVSDTYMVAGGLSGQTSATEEEIREVTKAAAECAVRLLKKFNEIDFESFGIQEEVGLRIGIHSGPVLAGIVGTKMGRYCLFGDTVNTASRMCTTNVEQCIQVSPATHEILKSEKNLKFEPRGEVEVKGKGKMQTYLLKH